MIGGSSLFAPQPRPGEIDDEPGEKVFGQRYRGRYHMPLLPGESGTKSGGDWVPYGLPSATNLAGAITDNRALATWLIERTLMGLAVRPDLHEQMTMHVNAARNAGADLAELKDSDAGVALRAQLESVHEQAKMAVGANQAAIMGTSRHTAWELRGVTGALIGTPSMNANILALEDLLEREGLVRVPGLSERVVRNTTLNAAGRFDDVLMSKRTGRLYLADLKTKRKAFYSWLETWIQVAVYATAEWMLDIAPSGEAYYIPGPRHHVDQECAILLRMPSDGGDPYLEPVDLVRGLEWAKLARAVMDARSVARSVHTVAVAKWRE